MAMKRLDVTEKLPNYKELEKFTVRRYNEKLPEDLLLFDINNYDYKLVTGENKAFSNSLIDELEEFVSRNASKMEDLIIDVCEKLFIQNEKARRNFDYEDFKHEYSYWRKSTDDWIDNIRKYPTEKCKSFFFLFDLRSKGHQSTRWDYDMENRTNESYFPILYDLYLKCGGKSKYIDYIEDNSDDTECTYALVKDSKIKKGFGITRKGAWLLNTDPFFEAMGYLNAINRQEVFIVIDNTEDTSVVLFGKQDLYDFLCLEKKVTKKNFMYYWTSMAYASSIVNMKGKRFIVNNTYVRQFDLGVYKYLGYSDEGKLLFGSGGYAHMFSADDMFDDIEYRVHNLELNLKEMRNRITSIKTELENDFGEKLSLLNEKVEQYNESIGRRIDRVYTVANEEPEVKSRRMLEMRVFETEEKYRLGTHNDDGTIKWTDV